MNQEALASELRQQPQETMTQAFMLTFADAMKKFSAINADPNLSVEEKRNKALDGLIKLTEANPSGEAMLELLSHDPMMKRAVDDIKARKAELKRKDA